MNENVIASIKTWIDEKTQPLDSGRRYSRCPICDATWWDNEWHNFGCWVPAFMHSNWSDPALTR